MYKKKLNSLTILIPAFNEKQNFNKFILKLKKDFNILVIDDCSSDGTSKFLEKKKIKYLRNKKNLGYELSLIKGLKFLKKSKRTKYILTMDGDGQHKPAYIKKIFSYLIKNNFDVVVGERERKNRIIEKVISKIFKKKFNIWDPLSGFKLYKKEKLKQINLSKLKKFFLVDLLILFINRRCNVKNFRIKTFLRKDSPRVGSVFFTNLKMLKILKFIYFKKVNEK